MAIATAPVAVVTGAAGFLGTQLTKSLLEKGYTVRATARQASTESTEHLSLLAKALPGSLELVSLDLQDQEACSRAMEGAAYVFHIAGPNVLTTGDAAKDQEVIFKPAIEGTRHIVRAAAAARVKRLICTSSIITAMSPFSAIAQPANENDWNPDPTEHNSYIHAKYQAEREATSLAAELGVDLITIVPSVVVGPTISTRQGYSIQIIKILLEGGSWDHCLIPLYIDIRDYALANLRAAETPSAQGRYLVSHPQVFTVLELHDALQQAFPEIDLAPVPKELQEFQQSHQAVDTGKLQTHLKVHPRLPAVSVVDQARSLLDLGIAKPQLKQAALKQATSAAVHAAS